MDDLAARRDRLLLAITLIAGAVLLAFLVARGVLREPPGVNAFGALADALMHGRLDVDKCPGIDCASYNGKTYIIFPPLPALVAAPFVAIFGFQAFKGFILLSLVLAGLTLWLWHAIFRALHVPPKDALWLILALAFASPLYQLALHGEGVWFFAQVVGILMTTAALWAVVCRSSLVLGGLFVALAFLCRQMIVFYPLFLAVLVIPPDVRLFDGLREKIGRIVVAGLPIVAALVLIFAYNWARFGNPLNTGYAFIHNPGLETYITHRITDVGLFSKSYVFFNALYLFIQGAHFEFTGPYLTKLTGLDRNGVALFVTSAWMLLAVYMRIDRVFVAGATVVGLIAGLTLFYHSNGADQVYAQRYAFDWLPIFVILMLRGERPAAFAALPVLVTWGVVSAAVVELITSAYRL